VSVRQRGAGHGHGRPGAGHMPVVADGSCSRDGHLPRLPDRLQQCLAGHCDVGHSTVQFEPAGHAAREPLAHA
jgi:cobalt-zinc-cadmium efflux system protein